MSAEMRDKRYNGRVASCNRARALERVGGLTIADPLPRLTGHLVADQNAVSKPRLHATVVEGARGWCWGRQSDGVESQQRRQCARTQQVKTTRVTWTGK